ncbi:MAG: sugar ABC transporter substrate-binding protein [Candidatus Eisenbacteria bacterium]|nr:sugar ABC transporter substrate-binding protein [Candidatus Eisenbacteria bacterium]
MRRPSGERPSEPLCRFRYVTQPIPAALLFAVVATLVSGCAPKSESPVVLRFWGMGREGEVVAELVPEFERRHPGIRIQVQQLPWSAAHEKLLTGYVGNSMPDLFQLGNTWVSEFATLRALEPLDQRVLDSPAVDPAAFFAGIWDTNVIDGICYGLPWYVDTRVLFYRKDLLTAAGYDSLPQDWATWRRAMESIKANVGPDKFVIFLPLNEWNPLAILGLQSGSPLLTEQDTRGAFQAPAFRVAFDFYLGLFRDGLAPPVSNTEIANVYQEFARGYFSMYITGPWNLGEFRRRLPPELKDSWGTSPLPGPEGASSGVSLAGGSSLAISRECPNKDAAWTFMEYLASPDVQIKFYHLTGDLPSRMEAWNDSALASDANMRAFGEQLRRVVSTPKVPEWEQIAFRLQERTEQAVRGAASTDSVLAGLDRDVARLLEKRRWLLETGRAGPGESP